MQILNERNNFIYLTVALILLLFTSALVESVPYGLGHWFLRVVILGTLVAAYMSLNFGARWRRFVMLLGCAIVVSSILQGALGWTETSLPDLFILVLFFSGEAYFASRSVLLSGEIDGNKMVGALAIYILLGLIWSMLYLITLEVWPDGFNGMEHKDWADNFSRVTYFSYVTMTSLGYGDISPRTPVAQVLAYLQAITGTFYMAVVVASMVGVHSSKKHS